MSLAKVGIKRSITAVGKKMTKGNFMRSNVSNRSSTRVVRARTITTFIMESPRKKGIRSILALSPPSPGIQS